MNHTNNSMLISFCLPLKGLPAPFLAPQAKCSVFQCLPDDIMHLSLHIPDSDRREGKVLSTALAKKDKISAIIHKIIISLNIWNNIPRSYHHHPSIVSGRCIVMNSLINTYFNVVQSIPSWANFPTWSEQCCVSLATLNFVYCFPTTSGQ